MRTTTASGVGRCPDFSALGLMSGIRVTVWQDEMTEPDRAIR